jgi:hypothetical protein
MRNKSLRTIWQVETAIDADQRLELAFAMLFSKPGPEALVDN